MNVPRSVLLCLAVVGLCLGDEPVEEVIVARKVPVLGGWFESNAESQEVQAAAKHAVDTFNTYSKAKRLFKLASITSAQTQVTNGLNYRINAVLGKTKCLKAKNHDLSNCNPEKKTLKCHFEVMFNPSGNKYEMQSQKCKMIVPKD
uniref:cystatin-F n=1 Tax=Doryrhamphus excisus TaxID=161450 RepID=UPI0025ADE403|nr:cystatin-F [Doryrhamphus excisus]